MTERSHAREQLAKALLGSRMGQLQEQLDDLAIPVRQRSVTIDRAAQR
jgi:hypothetical protein